MKTTLARGQLLGKPLRGLWSNSFAFAAKNPGDKHIFQGLKYERNEVGGNFFGRAKEFRRASRLILRDGLVKDIVNASARFLSVTNLDDSAGSILPFSINGLSQGQADLLGKILTAPVFRNRIKMELSQHDLIYPQDRWVLMAVDSMGWLSAARIMLILTHSHLYHLPESLRQQGTLAEGVNEIKGWSLGGINCFDFIPEICRVEVAGDPIAPKSLENDFTVVVDGRKIPFKKFINKNYPFERKDSPNIWGSRFAVECGAEIALDMKTGDLLVVEQRTMKVAAYDAKSKREIRYEHNRDFRTNADALNPAEFPTVFEYHFHPNYVPPIFSPDDISSRVKEIQEGKILKLVPHMVINFKGEGRIFIPKTENVDELEKLGELGFQLDANTDKPETIVEWEKHLRKHFFMIDVRFSEYGEFVPHADHPVGD